MSLSLDSLPLYYQAIVGMQSAAADLVPLLVEAKTRPYVLDDATIKRIVSLHAEQQQDVMAYHRQYQQWVVGDLTDEQRQQLNALHGVMLKLTQTHQQIFELVDEIKDYTVDQVLRKNTAELMDRLISTNQ